MRRHFVWLFLLLQAVAYSNAEAQTDQHVLGGASSTQDVAAAQRGGARGREPGADLVDAALAELRKTRKSLQHRIRKQSGVVGALLGFALKAVPTIRLSAPPPEQASKSPLSGHLLHASKLLEESARQNNTDALYLLAELNFYGNYSYPRDFKAAFDYYKQLALLNGNSSAHYMLGLMYSTGVGGAVEPDQARALLYYTFAANQGHTRAEMTVAHRHHAGISVPKSCDTAVKYYKRVADKAIAWYRSGPPGGMSWIGEAYRIADDSGGVYGEGASVSSAGHNAVKAHPNSDTYASIEDIIEYLVLMSQKGDFKASFNLGRIYYEGQRGLNKNMALAKKHFQEVTQKFWVKGGRPTENFKPGLDKTAAKAAGYIGRMWLRGEGPGGQEFNRAKYWFERGAMLKDPQCQFGLGLMYLNGMGVKPDIKLATDYFKAAADQDYAPAQVQLGSLYLDQGYADDTAAANHYFEMAARWGNLEAYYYIAEMNFFGVGREKSCNQAVTYYKHVAEKAEPLVSSWSEANDAYEDGDVELAFLEYLGAAEQGYEKAQNNVAYLLDPDRSRLPIPKWVYPHAERPALLQNPTLALIYWTRSSRQGNIDALVKMGDYYLYGLGTKPDIDKAVQCYTSASEYHQSAQALYNLGWMHEHGIGLNQDYHLAKRYYDEALVTNEEAYLPVTLSLLKLRAKSAWNTLTHGRINSIQDEPAPKKEWSLKEWINNFLQDDLPYYADDGYDDVYGDPMPGGDADPMGDYDDGILESFVIFGLAAALVFLVLYRQQRQQQARRREEEARRQQQGDAAAVGNQQQGQEGGGGLFPQPGDPAFLQWAAGGVGH